MGIYLNPSTGTFRDSLNSEIYVDKTGLIDELNRVINTQEKYICVSRPRRFGKTTALNMLSAYYGRRKDTGSLFKGLTIGLSPSYKDHVGKYDVLRINTQNFVSSSDKPIKKIQDYLTAEIVQAYPSIKYRDIADLPQVMEEVYSYTDRRFVILIDEWDCMFRNKKQEPSVQGDYLDFLRTWLKDRDYIAMVYMTGILPIKKYGTHSALNMFSEYSMVAPGPISEYFGFTEEEVYELCERYSINFAETKNWYDGYSLSSKRIGKNKEYSMYSPQSVKEAITHQQFGTYWNRTETYEALKEYIDLNMDGLRELIIKMLAGESVPVNPHTFNNDMANFATKDDVLTLLVHLGYLSYSPSDSTVRIPNKEVSIEYLNAISTDGWSEVARAISASKALLDALWTCDAETFAKGAELAHEEMSILKYNDENSLSCTISLALYYAREYYLITREYQSGKGFADVVYTPRPGHRDKPVIIIEFKRDSSAESAIAQIKEKGYANKFKNCRILIVGLNYNSRTKEHSCLIESIIC